MGVTYIDKSPEYFKKVEAAAELGLDAATQYLAAKMTTSMPGAGAARIERGTGVAPKFIPSNPGQPPGVRSVGIRGRQTQLLRTRMFNGKVGVLRWAAGTDVDYAKHLEFGTRDMPARPFMRPALNNNHKGIAREFNKGFKAKMGGGA